MKTRALSGQWFPSYEFFEFFFIFGKNEFQDGNVEAILGRIDASDEIDGVGTWDNCASFDAN